MAAPFTQLAPSGFPGQRYGSFAGKVAAPPPPEVVIPAVVVVVQPVPALRSYRRQPIIYFGQATFHLPLWRMTTELARVKTRAMAIMGLPPLTMGLSSVRMHVNTKALIHPEMSVLEHVHSRAYTETSAGIAFKVDVPLSAVIMGAYHTRLIAAAEDIFNIHANHH